MEGVEVSPMLLQVAFVSVTGTRGQDEGICSDRRKNPSTHPLGITEAAFPGNMYQKVRNSLLAKNC